MKDKGHNPFSCLTVLTLPVSIELGFLLAWWYLFHQAGFLFLPSMEWRFSNCVFWLAGAAFGCLIWSLLSRRGIEATGKSVPPLMFLLGTVCSVAFYLLAAHADPLGVVAAQCAIGFLVPGMLFVLYPQIRGFGVRELVSVVSLAFLICLAYSLIAATTSELLGASIAALFVLHLASLFLLAGSYFFFQRAVAEHAAEAATLRSEKPDEPHQARFPWQLAVNVIAYSAVFGVAHFFSSILVPQINVLEIVETFGGVIAVMLFCASFFVPYGNSEPWPRIRGIVFPLTVSSILILPLLDSSLMGITVALGQSAVVYYVALLMVWGPLIARMSGLSIVSVTTLVASFSALGFTVGQLSGMLLLKTGPPTATTFALLGVTCFVALAVTTLWIGDDKKARKLWGAAREISPKKYDDLVLKEKCSALAEQYALTKREQEVLLHLMQNERAEQISAKLFVSTHTVRSHIHNTYEKMGIHSFKELAKICDELHVEGRFDPDEQAIG